MWVNANRKRRFECRHSGTQIVFARPPAVWVPIFSASKSIWVPSLRTLNKSLRKPDFCRLYLDHRNNAQRPASNNQPTASDTKQSRCIVLFLLVTMTSNNQKKKDLSYNPYGMDFLGGIEYDSSLGCWSTNAVLFPTQRTNGLPPLSSWQTRKTIVALVRMSHFGRLLCRISVAVCVCSPNLGRKMDHDPSRKGRRAVLRSS